MQTLTAALQALVNANSNVANILQTELNSGIFEDSLTYNDVALLEKLNLYEDIVNCNFTQHELRNTLAQHNVTLTAFNTIDSINAIAHKFNTTYEHCIAILNTLI